jgi:hypothetical protein
MSKDKDTTDTCGCMAEIDKQLVAHNAHIDRRLMMNFKTGKASMSPPVIQLSKLVTAKKKSLPTLFAAYCPFCGKQYKEAKSKAKRQKAAATK